MKKYGSCCYSVVLGLLMALNLNVATAESLDYLKVDSSAAIVALLNDAEAQFRAGESEQAAALLERALRIDPSNPILWHNLAGVRLQQEDWDRAASLAAKSNALAVDNRWLQVRNWVVISLACEGMGDNKCAEEAQRRARALAG